MKLTKPDLHLLAFCICALAFFVIGGARVFRASNDFVPVYTGARCLLHGCNPYDTSQLQQEFFHAGGRAAELPSWNIDVPVYPPSTFLALSPLALLRFPAARLLWFLLNGCLFVIAAGSVLSMCPQSNRWLATALASFFLVTSGILLVLGQPAIFAISLLVIGTCFFLRGRFLPLGTFLLMLSLAVKPQIGGLIVFYLLVRRIHWRHALVAMAGALALLLSAGLILKLNPRSAEWTSVLRANLSATLSPGGSADPRPANVQAIGDTNLQVLTSVLFPEARRFNLAAYAIFLTLFAVWIVAIVRANISLEMDLVAIAALSVLSLTPVYHRFYDTRLLLLTVPAVLMVFQRRRNLGAVIAALTVLSTISLQYRVQVFLLQHAEWEQLQQRKLLFILLLRQQILEMIVLFCIYLFVIFSMSFSGGELGESSRA